MSSSRQLLSGACLNARNHATLNKVMFTALAAFICQYRDQNDIPAGEAVSNPLISRENLFAPRLELL